MKMIKTGLFAFLLTFAAQILWSQDQNSILVSKMEDYEIDIQNTYNEYQKVYYEKKSSKDELIAFENIISVYVSQILEIYETLTLSNPAVLEKTRDIAARALIFRALTYLEKAPLNVEFYEKACYDYYRALEMYNEREKIPVILKPLPKSIVVADKQYSRLIDLIDEKGDGLSYFGKIRIILENFKVTSDLNAETFEFIRFDHPPDKGNFTYLEAEGLIKKAVSEVFFKKEKVTFFLALPEGSYFIRSSSKNNPLYATLSTIYVRPNQQEEYIVEPLSDWIITFENPKTKRPDFSTAEANPKNDKVKSIKYFKDDETLVATIRKITEGTVENVDINKIFNLRDDWIQSRFIQIASDIIASHIVSQGYFDSWCGWMLSWNISKEITEKFSPGKSVPTELIQLIFSVLEKI